jgi:hypothetical protein
LLAHHDDAARYLDIRIACRLSLQQMIAALGHELRHAVEIADTPSVVDVASLGDPVPAHRVSGARHAERIRVRNPRRHRRGAASLAELERTAE